MRKVVIFALIAMFAAGCAIEEKPQRTLTKAERDSLIGESVLPGAAVVKGAIARDDEQKARAAKMDSLYESLGD